MVLRPDESARAVGGSAALRDGGFVLAAVLGSLMRGLTTSPRSLRAETEVAGVATDRDVGHNPDRGPLDTVTTRAAGARLQWRRQA